MHGAGDSPGSETGGRWLGGLDRSLRAMLLSPFVGQTLGTFVSPENTADLVALAELLESGQVTPAVERTFALPETAAAIQHMVDATSAARWSSRSERVQTSSAVCTARASASIRSGPRTPTR